VSYAPRIELFSRLPVEGWTCLGNDINGKDIHQAIKEIIYENNDNIRNRYVP